VQLPLFGLRRLRIHWNAPRRIISRSRLLPSSVAAAEVALRYEPQPVLSRYIFNLTGTGFRFNSNRGRVHSPLILIAICEGPQATAGDNFQGKSQAARMTAIESIEAHHQ
jgi:hypothetical protein